MVAASHEKRGKSGDSGEPSSSTWWGRGEEQLTQNLKPGKKELFQKLGNRIFFPQKYKSRMNLAEGDLNIQQC